MELEEWKRYRERRLAIGLLVTIGIFLLFVLLGIIFG